MSADNCIAILETAGEFRIANIKMIWLNDHDQDGLLMGWAEDFNFSEVYTDLEEACDAADEICDVPGTVVEYGVNHYKVDSDWKTFYQNAHKKGLWRPVHGECELCKVRSSGRRFEQIFICNGCHKFLTKAGA